MKDWLIFGFGAIPIDSIEQILVEYTPNSYIMCYAMLKDSEKRVYLGSPGKEESVKDFLTRLLEAKNG